MICWKHLVLGGFVLAADPAQSRDVYQGSPNPVMHERGSVISTASGTTPAGAKWKAQVPAHWNGTLVLWGRGYSPETGEPELTPNAWQDSLLEAGYALAGSNYGASGWALEEAVPAQEATLRAFARAYGRPKRTIAWGASMGGLVTTALAEKEGSGIDGAIAFCPSIGGAVGMMNMALDGAFAFTTLVAPDAGIRLVETGDDMANGRRAQAAVAAALQTPEGRARLALSGVLAGIPGWTRRDRPRPLDADFEMQVDEIGASFTMGAFLPRADQEQRAGGVFSWNTGVDYAAQLEKTGRRGFVEALYRKAGLDLRADLARLAAAPRITARPSAVRYMMAHYTPDARPRVPLVSVQSIGDGATSPSLQRAYIEAAAPRMANALWLDAAGHCGQPTEAAQIALHHLEARLDTGRWPARPAGAIAFTPPPMLRPCFRGRRCE